MNLGGEHTWEAHTDHLQPGVRKDWSSAEPTSEVSEKLPDSSLYHHPVRKEQKRLLEDT